MSSRREANGWSASVNGAGGDGGDGTCEVGSCGAWSGHTTKKEAWMQQQTLPRIEASHVSPDLEFQKLLAVAQHVEFERKARRLAERSLTALRREMDEYLASKDKRSEDALHLVEQVDQEIAARRQAERNLEVCEDAAREASARALKQCNALEVRCVDAELEVSEVRQRLTEVLCESEGFKDNNATLRSQLEHFIELSEQCKCQYLESEQCVEHLRVQLAEVQQDNLWYAARVEELVCGNSNLQECVHDGQQKHAGLSQAYQAVCAELVECRDDLEIRKQTLDKLNAEVRRINNIVENLQMDLKSSEAQRALDRESRREKEELMSQEIEEARLATRGEGLAISAFLRNIPASAALIVLFRYILGSIAGTAERAVTTRLSIHSASEISRHELESFLANDLTLKGPDRSVVSQALFGVLDLERHGVLYKKILCDRLHNPPSMKSVWLTELESSWPGRSQEMLRGWARQFRSPSPPSPCRSPSPVLARDGFLPSPPSTKRAQCRDSPRRIKACTPPCAFSSPTSPIRECGRRAQIGRA